jgi:uncharacterized protein
MYEPDSTGAIAYALNRLRTELRPELIYHSSWHTEHDVLPAAARLARLSGLPAADTQLLEVAAAYHDIGFIDTLAEHERRGAEIAAQVLPGYGFSPEGVDRIVGMIMATRLPQSPRDMAEAILADADLDLLGRDDFVSRNRALREELAAMGQAMNDYQWLYSQTQFLQGHVYFTPAARELRSKRYQENLTLFVTQLQDHRSACAARGGTPGESCALCHPDSTRTSVV